MENTKQQKHKKRYYKPKRGRKSPNRLTIWEQKFSRKLKRYHGTFAKKTFHRLMKKSSTLRSTLKRRSKSMKSNLIYRLKRFVNYYIGFMDAPAIIAIKSFLLITWHATILFLLVWAVSYTHLTLPTTPYV